MQVKIITKFQKAVCQIQSPSSKLHAGSGFLMKYEEQLFILTTNEVLPKFEKKEKVIFDYHFYGKKKEGIKVELADPFITDEDLNVTIVGISEERGFMDDRMAFEVAAGEGESDYVFRSYEVKDKNLEEKRDIEKNQAFVIYHHPVSGKLFPLHSSFGIIQDIDSNHLIYNAPVSRGSGAEGSIVLNTDFDPIAIHLKKDRALILTCPELQKMIKAFIKNSPLELDDMDIMIMDKMLSNFDSYEAFLNKYPLYTMDKINKYLEHKKKKS